MTRSLVILGVIIPSFIFSLCPAASADDWSDFNEFCKTHFGAEKENLAYQMFGNDLEFMDANGSEWSYISETSACIAFETNLPAKGRVEYGTTASYGSQTPASDRYHYLHIYHLKNLAADTTYHYRYVAEDERGNIITSADKTFTTATPPNVIYIPGALSGPQYVLAQDNATYVVTQDFVADYTAFYITGQNVTLDLGGHTVTYNEVYNQVPTSSGWWSFYDDASWGVKCRDIVNARVVNGTIVQGAGSNEGRYSTSAGYSPVYLHGTGEVAGVAVEFQGAQMCGIFNSSGVYTHHNIVIDRGSGISNRHNGPIAMKAGGADVHHNLIKRGRQNCLVLRNDTNCYNNEIYGDSFETNSLAINAANNTNISNNRIFGTGYMLQGITVLGGAYSGGSSDPAGFRRNVDLYGNFIHMQATAPTDRSSEYGPKSAVYAARMMWGGDNIDFHDNMLITYARDGGNTRGVWVETESFTTNVSFRNNLIRTILENTASTENAALSLAGPSSATDAAVMLFENNRIESNFCHVMFGDSYGIAHNVMLKGNTFVKDGPSRADYRTIDVGYWIWSTTGHKLIDSVFEGGASYDEVIFDGWGPDMHFNVGWTLTVETVPLAAVTIRDNSNAIVSSGPADAYGIYKAELLQYKENEVGRTYYTPHNVAVDTGEATDSTSVTMDAAKTVQILLPDPPSEFAGDRNGDGRVDIIDLNIILIDWGKSGAAISDPRADANGDWTVDIIDLNTILIDWGKVADFSLIVVNGSGDGTYSAGSSVPIVADAPGVGGSFVVWVGDTTSVADINASSTTVTMSADIVVSATYAYADFILTVVSGSGDGTYTGAQVVPITADTPLSGLSFDDWVGDIGPVANVNASSTTVTMPAADVTVTATYQISASSVVIPTELDGHLRYSQYASWTHNGVDWVLRYPANYILQYKYYDSSWDTFCHSSVGPGYNGADYFDPNLPSTLPDGIPGSTWNDGYEFAPYTLKAYFTFDIAVLAGSTVTSAVLNVYEGGYGQNPGQTATGKCYVLDSDPIDAETNWTYASAGVPWTTPGGDYDTGNYTTWSITKTNDPRGDHEQINVGSLVQSAITAGKSKVTLLLVMDIDATPFVDDDDVHLEFFAIEGSKGGFSDKIATLDVSLAP